MTYKIFFIFASILISLTVHQQFVNALRCWRCSSDTSNGSNTAFCDDPFDENAITEQHRQWVYVECSIPPTSPNINSLLRHAVCKKLVQLVSDKRVVSRSCYWEEVNARRNDCINADTPSNIKTISCETCQSDGCNKH